MAQSLAAAPARRAEVKPAPFFSGLPFVYRPKRGIKNASNWRVAPADDYGAACARGTEYAAHFARWLKANPGCVGGNMLGHIAADIDFQDESSAKGYWVGFFSYLERLIHAQAKSMDVFADADRINAFHAEIEARRDLEAETGEV